MSKANGFSDISANAINFDPVSNTLIVAYKDANIDIVQNGTITNLPDIEVANISGNKSINNIFFISPYAYLACGFGIVVVDVIKHETKDTYFIGPNGSSVNVDDINASGDTLFAATDIGIFTAALSNPNLDDYTNWNLQRSGLPTGNNKYNTLACFNGKIYANNSRAASNQTDQVFESDGMNWILCTALTNNNDNYGRLRVNNNLLVAVGKHSIKTYNTNEILVNSYISYGFANTYPADALVDNNNVAWAADISFGLVKFPVSGSVEILVPNGPRTTNVYNMAYANGVIWSVPGAVNSAWGNVFNNDGVSVFYGNTTWSTMHGQMQGIDMDSVFDVMSVAIDSLNPLHAFVGTWGEGVIEFNNGQFVKQYIPANSSLSNNSLPGYFSVRIGGVAFDGSSNLWITNALSSNILSVKTKGGTWKAINFATILNQYWGNNAGASANVGNLIVSKFTGQKWVIVPKIQNVATDAIVVYNDNGTFAAPCNPCLNKAPPNTIVITAGTGKGALPGNVVSCMAEDQNGEIWIGTDQGVAVENNPSDIFSGGSYDAQPVYVQQNGYTQLLFQAEPVTAIAVDGANRKWFGTEASGVFLMSADGTTQIYNFTTSNSPLLSNNITSITINGATGEVFFGTQSGIISYKSTATDGGTGFGNVYAYPNPVKHDYTGLIAIKGLALDADVRITDITGTLIFRTTALGGQAIWNGCNFSGERAHTGVYLVLCVSSDGTSSYATKILFIN
jgi:hypothetical protein